MRALIALPLLALALAGCKVSKDEGNDSVTAEFNGEVAQNAAEDIGNFTENVASDVGNEADKLGDKAENVDVSVDTNKAN
jgi:hypothetical protein